MALGRFRCAGRERTLWPICAAAALALALPFIGYLTDDTFIYLQFAGNLASGQGFSFNAGEPAYGFTSPLWTILLAGGARAGFDPLTVAKVLGGLFLLASVPAFALASNRIVPSRHGRLAAMAAWSANAWMIRWSLSGMETAMAVFLVLASVAAWMADRENGRLPFLSATLIGLAALTRPECLGLAGLAGLDALLHSGRRRIQMTIALAVGFGAVAIPWALYANAHFGAVLPHTVYAKGGGWPGNPADLTWAIERVATIVCATSIIETSAVLTGSMMALRALPSAGIREWLRIRFLPASWTLSLLTLYSLRGESALVSRYLLPAICWIVLFGFAMLDTRGIPRWYGILRERFEAAKPERGNSRPFSPLRRTQGLASGRERAPGFPGRKAPLAGVHAFRQGHDAPFPAALTAWILAAAVVMQNLVMLYGINYPSAMRITESLRGHVTEVATWIRENTPQDATIGLLDIGVIGFYGRRRIVDLHGHLDPKMHRIRGKTRIEDFVRELGFASVARPEYLVDRWVEHDLHGQGSLRQDILEPLFTRRVGDLGIRRRDEFHYTVYRIHWDRFDGAGHGGR